MVYVPILKIDLPEPRLQEIIPGIVTASVETCTRVFDLVHDYLRPLSLEQEVILYTAAAAHLPREFRKARKKIAEKNIEDEDKMSEELEDAGYAYYRRRMREYMAGYSDEDTEDVTFRRLMSPYSAERDLYGVQQPGPALDMAAAGPSPQEAAAAAAAVRLPSKARRVTVTTAAGGVGLALGVSVLKLTQLLSRLWRKQKPKGRRAQQQAGIKRQPSQGSTGKPPRSGSSRGGGAARTTPRTPRRR